MKTYYTTNAKFQLNFSRIARKHDKNASAIADATNQTRGIGICKKKRKFAGKPALVFGLALRQLNVQRFAFGFAIADASCSERAFFWHLTSGIRK